MSFSRSGGSVGALAPVQPFEFATYRSPTALAKTTTILLSTAQSEHNLAIPVGRGTSLRPGKIFQFIAGGTISTGNSQGTLMIAPYYGAGTTAGGTGITLGPSAEQAYAPGLVNVPWRLVGEIVFLSVSLLANSSKIWCTGAFFTGGDPNVQGSGLSIAFGGGNPLTIDSKGPIGTTSGAINIAATFAAPQVTASITAQYALVRST